MSTLSLVATEQPYLTVSSGKDLNNLNELLSNGQTQHSFSRIVDFFKNSGVAEIIESEILPPGNLYYGDRLQLLFRLSPTYHKYFPLLRSLLGFGKFASLKVSPAVESQTFQAIISSGNESNVIDYFQTLFAELASDVEFKKVLRELLGLQNEASRIYKASLFRLAESVHRTF